MQLRLFRDRSPGAPESKVRSTQLVMDVLVPLQPFNRSLSARIAVVELTHLFRLSPKTDWVSVGRSYVCGTNYGVFVKGLTFPFRTFLPRQYDALTNSYEAANHYANYLGEQVVPLIARPESLKYLYLAQVATPRLPNE